MALEPIIANVLVQFLADNFRDAKSWLVEKRDNTLPEIALQSQENTDQKPMSWNGFIPKKDKITFLTCIFQFIKFRVTQH